MFAFNNGESADARADEDACTLRQLRADRQACLLHRTFGGSHRVVDEQIHLLDVFFLEPVERVEIFDFGGDLRGKLSGIETGDPGNAAASFAKALPGIFSSRSQRGYQTHAGDHNSSLLQNTTSKRTINAYDLGMCDSM